MFVDVDSTKILFVRFASKRLQLVMGLGVAILVAGVSWTDGSGLGFAFFRSGR